MLNEILQNLALAKSELQHYIKENKLSGWDKIVTQISNAELAVARERDLKQPIKPVETAQDVKDILEDKLFDNDENN